MQRKHNARKSDQLRVRGPGVFLSCVMLGGAHSLSGFRFLLGKNKRLENMNSAAYSFMVLLETSRRNLAASRGPF